MDEGVGTGVRPGASGLPHLRHEGRVVDWTA